jgi:hypothetical protein
VCLSKKKYPKFILLAVVELRESERDKTQKLKTPAKATTAKPPDRPSPSHACCCHRPHLTLVAASQALTSLGHATLAAGARQTGQWFGSQIWYFFFFFFFSSLILFLST